MTPDPPADGFYVPAAQAYAELNQRIGVMTSSISQLERTMHPLPAQVAEHDAYLNTLRQAGLPDRFNAVEAQVETIKARQMWMIGAGSALAFVGGLLGGFLPTLLR